MRQEEIQSLVLEGESLISRSSLIVGTTIRVLRVHKKRKGFLVWCASACFSVLQFSLIDRLVA